ncbi:MAG: alpha/beta hydrolase [Lachnospiraceae bacterium]|nr:alpha/beta hydrolase [Lachnospiraceae bacterium]
MGTTEKSPIRIYTKNSRILDVKRDPAFGTYGRLIFPADSYYCRGNTLEELDLVWYSCIDPEETVEIVNDIKRRAESGEPVFFDIYTEAEKAADPAKRDTGLFFFPGKPGGKFAICNAGGAFAYVGAMQDSFPHALKLSRMGYHAFALIYRPGAVVACQDLARAIRFVFEHSRELQVDTRDYSLWGGSAGARMAAWLGCCGTAAFGERILPRPAAVIMQYTGHSEYSADDPPTYACVGNRDWIADWRVMKNRLAHLARLGVDTEFHVYPGLGHGFGLGTGTAAEGWIYDAATFWEKRGRQR